MGVLIKNKICYTGGSGGSSYKEITLWSGNETPTSSGTDITLSKSIVEFDAIYFHVENNDYGGDNLFFVSDLEIGESYIAELFDVAHLGTYFTYTSNTQIKIYRIASANPITYTKVVGIKFGGGGNAYVNYSTDEHIVGSWVDGSPIYERTLVNDITGQAEHWYVYLDTLIDNINDYTILNWEGNLQFKEGSYIYSYMSPNSGASYYINRNSGRWYLYFHSGNATCDWGVFTATIRYVKEIYGQPSS